MLKTTQKLTETAVVLGLACTFFLGCMGTHPVIPTRFYLLPPAAYKSPLDTGTEKTEPVAIEIQALRLPQYLEKPQIVTRSSKNRLTLAEYDQWGGNLRKNINRVMRQNLSRLLSTPHVAQAPFDSPSASGYRIKAEVMAFEADTSGIVTLKVQWQLSDRASGRLLAAKMSSFTRQAAILDMDGFVDAMGAAMGDFCLAVAQAVQADMTKED